MFGYICPKVCELKVCEFEEYKRYYCGLCKALQKDYSRRSALFLSNDCVFIYILLSALAEDGPEYQKNRCLLHGDRRAREVAIGGFSDYAAALSVMLAYWKADDDVRDTGRFRSRVSRSMLKSAMKKAEKRYPEAAKAVSDMINCVSGLEAEKSSDMDAVSHAFACMFGKVLEYPGAAGWEDLYDLGYNIGKYIYLIDAADDLEKDRESGDYNVLLEKFGDDAERALKEADFSVFMSLSNANGAFGRLKILRNEGILKNTITLGLSERAVEILKGKKVESV